MYVPVPGTAVLGKHRLESVAIAIYGLPDYQHHVA